VSLKIQAVLNSENLDQLQGRVRLSGCDVYFSFWKHWKQLSSAGITRCSYRHSWCKGQLMAQGAPSALAVPLLMSKKCSPQDQRTNTTIVGTIVIFGWYPCCWQSWRQECATRWLIGKEPERERFPQHWTNEVKCFSGRSFAIPATKASLSPKEGMSPRDREAHP
jgi:hypothetical protein